MLSDDRHRVGRQLQMDVAVGAVEHHLALIEPGLLDEAQIHLLAGDSDHPS